MSSIHKSLLLGTAIALATLAFGQSASDLVGQWRGEENGAPWVTVNIVRTPGGQFSGSAVFYILDRGEKLQTPKVLGKQEVALVDPKITGNAFSFNIKNQQGTVTMNPSSPGKLEFKMIVHSEALATLKSEGPNPLAVEMVKQK